MSMKVSYQKQLLLFLLMIFIILIILEISVIIFEIFFSECKLIDAISLPYSYIQKRSLCYDFNHIFYEYEPVISIKPNQHFSTVNINDFGFRGPELKHNESKYRIVIMGGSTVFGAGVTDNETIPAELSKKLSNFNKIEVINAGISSITSNEELYHIKHKILELKPNLIIVYDGANDAYYEKTDFSVKITNNKFQLKDIQQYYRTPVVIYRNILLPLLHHQGSLQVHNSPGNLEKFNSNNDSVSEITSDIWYKNMKDFCKTANENGIKSVVLLQPTIYTGTKKLTEFEKQLYVENKHYVSTYNMMKDKLEHLSGCTIKKDYSNTFENEHVGVYFDGVHLNNLGNKIIANRIYVDILPIINIDA